MIGLLAAAVLAAYDCQLETPRAVDINGASANASEIGLPAMALRFSVAISEGNPPIAKVSWPGDPMQVAGDFPAVNSAPNSYAFSAFSGGPCLFTEGACLTQVNLVDRNDGNARIILTPVALAKDEKSGARSPFAVIAQGQCSRTDVKR